MGTGNHQCVQSNSKVNNVDLRRLFLLQFFPLFRKAHVSTSNLDRSALQAAVQGCYAAFAVRDLNAITRLSSPECTFEVPGIVEHMPWARSHQGHDGISELWRELDQHLVFDSFQANEYLVDERFQSVVVLGVAKCTSRATGLSYINNWAHLFRLKDGLIQYFREYPDTAAQLVVMHPL